MEVKRPGFPSDLKIRALSALVLAPIVLGAVWLGDLPFLLMIAVAIILMACEWARLTCAPNWYIEGCILAVSGLTAAQLMVRSGETSGVLQISLVCVTILAGMSLIGFMGWVRGEQLRWRLLGVPYISLGPASLVWLREQENVGLTLILWLLLVIWAMDIGAYFAGRAIGGPKLAPRVSPNKTWAGLIGGMTSAAIVGGAVASVSGFRPVLLLAVVSALLGAWSQAGDIAESYVKRHFGVKDMSNLIPGHGGILDRLDGLLFAAPAMVPIVIGLGSI
ncbi:MAG: phosphatidate cytidylyltransferase [Alphaproteobacteria bacterium]|nr:phosphatidate cytidylyltransferase [Alphaproteobacteria bacterium]